MDKQSKRHQSSVWKRFTRYEREGNRVMRCLECGLELKTQLASNAKRHMRTVHQLADPDLDDLLEREENKSASQRLNDQMLSLFLEKQRLWMETYTIGATIAHIIIKPTGGSPEDSKPQAVARAYYQEDDQKRKSRTLQTRLAVSRYRSKVANTNEKINQLQNEVELCQYIRQCQTAIADNLLDIQHTYAMADVSRPTTLNRDVSVGSFIAAYTDLAAGYDLERPTEGDYGQFAALIPKGEWIMVSGVTTSREDDLVMKCLECVPIWRMAEGVKSALLNRHSRFLARLYKIICGATALMYSYTHGQVNYNIIARLSDPGVGNISSLVDPMLPRVYSVSQRSFFLIAIEPHGGCRNDVVMDVLRTNNAATVSFNFYESCARAVPCLRKFLQANIQHLPRELSLQAQLMSSHVDLRRPWSFEDSVGKTFDKSRIYTVQRPLGTLRRYVIQRLHISFEDSGLHFLDTLLEPFRKCIASAKAEQVEVYGFSKIPAVYGEEIDRIKECLILMGIHEELWFRLTESGQLNCIFRDNCDFPKVEHLRISLDRNARYELPTGEALEEALWALTSSRNPVLACGTVTIEVTGINKPAPALRPILDLLASDWCPRRVDFILRHVIFDGSEMDLFSQHDSFIKTTQSAHCWDGTKYSMHQRNLKLFVHQTIIDITVLTASEASELTSNEISTIHVWAYNAARGPYATSLNDKMPTYAEPSNDANFF